MTSNRQTKAESGADGRSAEITEPEAKQAAEELKDRVEDKPEDPESSG